MTMTTMVLSRLLNVGSGFATCDWPSGRFTRRSIRTCLGVVFMPTEEALIDPRRAHQSADVMPKLGDSTLMSLFNGTEAAMCRLLMDSRTISPLARRCSKIACMLCVV